MNKEIWKDIKDYEGLYQVSNRGRIKSLQRYVKIHNGQRLIIEKILKLGKRNGYYVINLRKKGIRKNYQVHRLVAQAFILNVNNKPYINHKDENRQNNNVENLEWCTQKENVCWSAYKMKKQHNCKLSKITNEKYIRKKWKKYELTINKKYIGIYNTLEEAVKKRNSILNEGDD